MNPVVSEPARPNPRYIKNTRRSTRANTAIAAGMLVTPPPEWWLESYVTAARGLEGETDYAPRTGEHRDYRGPIWRFVEERVAAAHARGLPIVEACEA